MRQANFLSDVEWLTDRGVRSGRCRNDIYCLLADGNRAQRIKPGERFVCPECLKPLKQFPDPAKPRSRWHSAWLMFGGGLAASAICLFLAHSMFAGRRAVSVFVVLPSDRSPIITESIVMPPQTKELALTARKLANKPVIAYGDLAPGPSAAIVTRQAEQIASPRVAESSKQNRGFSGVPIAGGEPAFPDLAGRQPSTGLVRVTCRIETNGVPTDCQASALQGGHSFSNAVSSWLKSGSVRFAPILQHGQPVAEVNSWDIEFSPDLPDQ